MRMDAIQVIQGIAIGSRTTGLGNLCKRGHDAGGGQSLRYMHKKRGTATGSCVKCGRENGKKNRARQTKVRRMKALDQGRFDEKYRGTPCKLGHVLRYVQDGSCVVCDTERRRKRAQDPDRVDIERARKFRDNEKRSIDRVVEKMMREEGV